MTHPARIGVIDSCISVCDVKGALDALQSRLGEGEGGYVCFTNVHTAVTGRRDLAFRAITNQALLALSDGKPIYWVGRLKGARGLGHVPGPDFLLHAMRRFVGRRHFFYGSSPAVLDQMVRKLNMLIEGAQICGALAPPFHVLSAEEKLEHYAMIRASKADFVWIGLGAPKQEQWMAEAWQHLKPSILLGVGAAFDFHAGTAQRAPAALRHAGLEWLHRLLMEPRRLWKRYLATNTLFIAYVITDLVRGA